MGGGTRWGIGLSPDSVVYIVAARNLLHGDGLSVFSSSGDFAPMIHYPPLLSILLASIGFSGIDPIDSSRVLNVVLFGVNISLLGLLVHASARSFWLSVSASFLMLISFPMVLVHSMAWSEPIFILFALLGLFFLIQYTARPSGPNLAAAALSVGLACIARYAGVSLIATGAIGIFLLATGGRKKRLLDAMFFCSISSLLVVLWGIRNIIVAGSPAGRKIVFHPPGAEQLESALITISGWLLPPTIPSRFMWAGTLGMILLAVSFLLASQRGGKMEGSSLHGMLRPAGLAGLLAVNYVLLLAFSISFLDAQIPLDNRILAPIYVAALIGCLCLVNALFARLGESGGLSIALALLLAGFSTVHLMKSASWMAAHYYGGVGYASREWKQSEVIRYIDGLEPQIAIFSNGPDVIALLTGRFATMIPRKINPETRSANGRYPDELAAMKRELQARSGVLVYFHKLPWRWYLPSEGELREGLRLRLRAGFGDGSIYQ